MTNPRKRGAWLPVVAALLLAACGGDYSGDAGDGGAPPDAPAKSCDELFTQRVQPRLAFCRNCHVPGGIADVPDGNAFLLTSNPGDDLVKLKAASVTLGDRILKMASGTDARAHSGGAPWPVDSAAYRDMAALLAGFDDPAACTVDGDAPPAELPLLGSQRGGHAWFDFCADDGTAAHAARPDSALLPPDPRSLVQPGVSDGKAVHFNTWWKDCHIDPELVGERAHPRTCGELRESYARGERLMMGNGGVGSGTFFAGSEPQSPLTITAEAWNTMWMGWGLTERPDNFDQLVAERFGVGFGTLRNPYPLPGEDPNTSNGGSGQLPIGATQTHNADGTWSGIIGLTCHGSGVAGLPEEGAGLGVQYGSGSPLGDVSVISRDLAAAGSPITGVFAMFATNRGTNNAQFANIVTAPSTPEQFIGWLTSGTTASMDTPAWWNVGHRPVKFIDGVVPADAVRVDMAFYGPLLAPGAGSADAWVKEHDTAADHWLVALKSPAYPLAVDTALAEQGAILFHSKNLWAESLANPVPRPEGGNGSCASCHGAYSPRFVHDPAFLADPALEGVASNIVPLEVIATDRERLDAFTDSGAAPGEYPETAGTDQDCTNQNSPELRGDRALGYLAPPLYGIWATAPYLHNGSVPDAWTLLKSAERPAYWRRVSTPAREDQAGKVVMGFDVSIQRAFDAATLGWKYDRLACGAPSQPFLECDPGAAEVDPLLQELLGMLYSNVLLAWNAGNAPSLAQFTPQQIEARKIYNTHQLSQGNGGHAFTDVLTDAERRAIIEYLKTL